MPSQLRKIDENIWVVDDSFVILGVKGSARMTIVRFGDGQLFIHSPTMIDDQLSDQIEALGAVAHIVAPNLFHHLFFMACAKRFPNAQCWAPKGLGEKLKGELPDHQLLDDGNPVVSSGELEQIALKGHGIRETVFFHAPSKTLITADMIYHYQGDQYPSETLFFRLVAKFGELSLPFYHKFAAGDKSVFLAGIERAKAWPFERIIMSHGAIYEGIAAREKFAQAWVGLLR